MIRLDPAAPPLWRADGSVQFGAPALARLTSSAAWTDAVVDALETGITPGALRALVRVHRGSDADVESLLAHVSPVLRRRDRATVVVQSADDLPRSALDAVLAALPPRTRVVPWAGSATEDLPRGARVILLAAHRVDPRRASAYVRDDVLHLPLVLAGSRARVGPVVAPGRSACLACLDAHARHDDAQWPALAAQLLARPRPDVNTALAAEAGRAARALLSAPVDETTRSLLLRADSYRRVWEMHRPSADCQCRSHGESATANAPSARILEPS